MISVMVVSASGPTQGMGHERRAGRIADALSRRGTVQVVHRTLVADPNEDAIVRSMGGEADIVVVDVAPTLHGKTLRNWLGRFRQRGSRVVGIDGPLDGVDMLVVPSFMLGSGFIEPSGLKTPRLCWGWDYLILDQRRDTAVREPNSPVLVLTGGSDPTGLAGRLPKMLDVALPEGVRITWVVGPHGAEPSLPATPRLEWTSVSGVEDLRRLMEAAGHALAVYGVSVLELLHHGIPTVVFSPYGDRDRAHLDSLESEGVALVAADEAQAVERLATLICDRALADRLARRAAACIPESGTERIVDAILGLV
jgi:spore coat polysaccharide biosynthesis predicted glycosyltransferase SpsG